MKKLIYNVLASGLLFSLSLNAQNDKKQEPKKEEKKSESAAPAGGTRMAISQKGLPGKSSTKKDNTAAKTSGNETKKEEPKK